MNFRAAADMVIGLVTLLLAVAAAATVYLSRSGGTPNAAAEPVEILLSPQDLQQLLAPTPSKAPAPEQPSAPLASGQVLQRLRALALGASFAGATRPGPGHAAIAAAAVAATEDGATLRQLAPRRPSLLPQLIRAANDDAAPRRELAAIIRRDPSLVGGLLEMANSSFYRVSERPVESIDRAVVLLGSEGIRSLIAAAAMQPIFRVDVGPFPQFAQTVWEHAWRSANAAVVHAAMAEKADPFAAELLSLVWGLADVVLFRAVLERYEAAAGRGLRPMRLSSRRFSGLIPRALRAASAPAGICRKQASPLSSSRRARPSRPHRSADRCGSDARSARSQCYASTVRSTTRPRRRPFPLPPCRASSWSACGRGWKPAPKAHDPAEA